MKHENVPDLLTLIRGLRAILFRNILKKRNYYMFSLPNVSNRSMEPISKKFGFDRGTPVDRYYIERFIKENSEVISGKVLEITDNYYSKTYGGDKVTQSDALDIRVENKEANIHGDLRNLNGLIENDVYDCLIITQTYVMIDDYESAIKESLRILKKGGTLLVTMPCLGPVWNIENHHWRFTKASAKYVFEKLAPNSKVEVQTYGNVLAGQAFWVGLSIEELSQKELEYNDKFYPLIVSIKVVK